MIAAIADAQVVLARRTAVTFFALTGTSSSLAFTTPTASGGQLCHSVVEWTRKFSHDLGLQGKRYIIRSGALYQTAVVSPRADVTCTGAVVANTIAATVVVAGPIFARRGIPTRSARAHKILMGTANTVTITILGAYHFTAVVAFSMRMPPRVANALPIVTMTVQITCFWTFFH